MEGDQRLGSDEDNIKQAEQAAAEYREWAKREREAGNEARAKRLEAHADNVHRNYGTGQRHLTQGDDDATDGLSTSQGGSAGCLGVVMLLALAAASATAWPIWESLA